MIQIQQICYFANQTNYLIDRSRNLETRLQHVLTTTCGMIVTNHIHQFRYI